MDLKTLFTLAATQRSIRNRFRLMGKRAPLRVAQAQERNRKAGRRVTEPNPFRDLH